MGVLLEVGIWGWDLVGGTQGLRMCRLLCFGVDAPILVSVVGLLWCAYLGFGVGMVGT